MSREQMTAERAYEYAVRIRDLGLRYFPRGPAAVANVGAMLAKLPTEEHAEEALRRMAAAGKWNPAVFSKLIQELREPPPAPPPPPEPETWADRLNRDDPVKLHDFWQEAEKEAEAVPKDNPQYAAAARRFTQKMREYREHHGPNFGRYCTEEPFFERNVRCQLTILFVERKARAVYRRPAHERKAAPDA